MTTTRPRADYRRAPPEIHAALSRLDALRDIETAPDLGAGARAFGALLRGLGYPSYVLGALSLAGEAPDSALSLGEGEMAAAAARYVAAGRAARDPIARRLATAREGFTLERYFARPVDRAAGDTLAAHVADLRAHGLRHVAATPVPGARGARRYVLAVAGAPDDDPDRFAARFRETEWLLRLAATSICARLEERTLAPPSPGLSASEARVVERLARGLRAQDIAAALGKSERTVRNQIDSAKRRLGVETSPALVAAAIRLGLIRI